MEQYEVTLTTAVLIIYIFMHIYVVFLWQQLLRTVVQQYEITKGGIKQNCINNVSFSTQIVIKYFIYNR